MEYTVYPPVKNWVDEQGWCQLNRLEGALCAQGLAAEALTNLPAPFQPRPVPDGKGFFYQVGQPPVLPVPTQPQSYALRVAEQGIVIHAADLAGLRYGLDTLTQLLTQGQQGRLRCLTLHDYPTLPNRGLMLDVSRGKVYTREYLLCLVDLLGHLRYNVFQLYVEHTFAFQKHPDISANSDPLTAKDILAVQERCKRWGIDFQPCLQSLGHCTRLLTRPAYQYLAESDMNWSLSTTSSAVQSLLEDLYAEYLPLFESEWLNVCMDEPYDIGRGQSADSGQSTESLYINYLIKIHALAAHLGKKLMVFGDFLLHHPESLSRLPTGITFLDWCYDPKPVYGTPELFAHLKVPFWVCPGTGNWNTLFPRLDGAIINLVNMVGEGIAAGAEGMLLTDWSDHGAYTQPGTGYHLYAYAAAVAWVGSDPGAEVVDAYADVVVKQPGYAAVVRRLAEIYQLPPVWSRNRSQCVMTLFDEPIFGGALRGPVPPATLKAYDLSLPEGIQPVYERHSQHPLRPFFAMPPELLTQISAICQSAQELLSSWEEGALKRQFEFIVDAFDLMVDKLALSRAITERFATCAINPADLLAFEDALRLLIRRFVKLQARFTANWLVVAKFSEMDISLAYFAGIITRLDYLRDWLSLQRERLNRSEPVDFDFLTYQTCGYTTLPTY